MSGPVIIRLQNLPLEARSIDIRRFFEGLQIPDGGVHIIGGEKGDAFIAFQSDEDARQAMARDSMPLCNARIKLYLSSKTEMQNVISAARNQQLAAAAAAAAATTAAAPKATTLPSSIEQILFRSAQPVVTPKPPSTASNPAEILNNLTKLFSGPSQSNAAAEQPKPVAQPAPKQDLDPILASILPIITQQKSAAGQGSSAINPSSFISSSASQQTAQQASSSSSASSKISINQLFDILQSHMKQPGPETTAPPKREPEYTEPQTRGNNGRDYQSYNQQRGGPVLGTAMPYRHGEPGIPGGQSSQAPPIKYATSSSSSSNLNGSNSPSQSSSATTSTGAAPSTTKLDPIIRVKNFAPAASYKEIRTFLQGVQIEHDGIKLLYDANGQKTGQAFVRLMGIIDLKKALCRNKQFYEDRQIEVLQSNEHEFATTNVVVEYPAMQRQRMLRQQQQQQQQPAEPKRSGSYQEPEQETSGSPQNGFYLKIYGLPVSFDDQQLKAMFNNVKFVRIATSKPTPISTKIVNSDGSNENVTIVKAKKLCQVETQLDLERALTRQDERVGKSKVQIFQINKSEYDREMSSIPANRRPQYNNNNNGNSNYSNGGNNDDHNENDAEYMDTNETNDRDRDSRVRDYDAANENNNNGHGSNGGTNGSGESDVYIYMHGVPFSAREHEVKAFFPPAVQPRAVFFLIDAERLKNTGECLCEFASRYERDRALLKDGQLIRNRVITVRSISPGDFRQQLSQLEELREKLPKRGTRQPLLHTPQSNNEKPRLLSETLINLMKQQQANNPSSLKRSAPSSTTTNTSSQQKRIRSSPEPSAGSPPPNIVELPPLPPELQRHKKSIVLLSNVSFEATREDILELFRPYTPIEQTLKIRHDDQGQPTGDAIVACKNSDEAVKACSHLNGSNFMGRNIRAVMLEP